MVRRILITDADNRLGLEFVRQYAAEGWEVFAACREPGKAGELNALGKSLKVLTYDPLNDASLSSLTTAIGATPLDVVIANESVGGGPIYLVSEITQKDWMEVVGANTFAPAKLALALQPNLQHGTSKKLVGISSLAASIALSKVSGQYAYRASKAALNSIWRTFSVEWRPQGIACLLLSPGELPESVSGMRVRIAESTIADSGRFFNFDGAEVPW